MDCRQSPHDTITKPSFTSPLLFLLSIVKMSCTTASVAHWPELAPNISTVFVFPQRLSWIKMRSLWKYFQIQSACKFASLGKIPVKPKDNGMQHKNGGDVEKCVASCRAWLFAPVEYGIDGFFFDISPASTVIQYVECQVAANVS